VKRIKNEIYGWWLNCFQRKSQTNTCDLRTCDSCCWI